ncbi:MAG: ABC transporter ATP-binding protein [Lachnospiraceae bacterium]|nr:ABC transporter ATP-binding protein [Lachnospiraceae bacterium]
MIEVKNLTKVYGDHVAVDDISFSIDDGKIYGFLGPNGAGKSTTMNIMTGYLAATSGSVTINGHDIVKEPGEAKKCIGYLPELPPLYSDMTVNEYLWFVSELKKIPKEAAKMQISDVLGLTGIIDVKDRLIKNLSKGYKQRVGLAQAIIGYPPIIILDEPTVGLDPKQIIEIRDLIKKLGQNHTVILSSHILSEVSAVCDNIIIISNGKLVASDTAEGLQERTSKGETALEVIAMGSKDSADKVLASIPEIRSFEYRQAEESGTVRFIVRTSADTDIRKNLSLALTSADIPVITMNKIEESLEDIFLKLTGDTDNLKQVTKSNPYGNDASEDEKPKKHFLFGKKKKEDKDSGEDGE